MNQSENEKPRALTAIGTGRFITLLRWRGRLQRVQRLPRGHSRRMRRFVETDLVEADGKGAHPGAGLGPHHMDQIMRLRLVQPAIEQGRKAGAKTQRERD